MLLKFGNDFCTACEPIARVWYKGNDPIRHRPIAMIVNLHLPEIHALSLVHRSIYMTTIQLTVLAVLNVLLLATGL